MSDIQIVITERPNGPDALKAEAEIHFVGGDLQGLKLVGFSIYKSVAGELYVTLPSRAFGVGGERRYFDYLRTIDGNQNHDTKKLKEKVLAAYKSWEGAKN